MISLRACPNKRLVKSKAARKKNNLYMMSTAQHSQSNKPTAIMHSRPGTTLSTNKFLHTRNHRLHHKSTEQQFQSLKCCSKGSFLSGKLPSYKKPNSLMDVLLGNKLENVQSQPAFKKTQVNMKNLYETTSLSRTHANLVDKWASTRKTIDLFQVNGRFQRIKRQLPKAI